METGLGVDLAALLEEFADAVIAADRSNRIVYANPAAATLVGWSRDELIGSALTALMPPRFRPLHRKAFARFFETGEPTIMGRPMRVRALHADGGEIPVDLVLSPVTSATGDALAVGVLRDASDRVELEHRQAVAVRFMDVLGEASGLEAAGPQLLAALGEELGWEVATLWVTDANGRRLTPLATWESPEQETHAFTGSTRRKRFARGEGLPGRVWASGTPTYRGRPRRPQLRPAVCGRRGRAPRRVRVPRHERRQGAGDHRAAEPGRTSAGRALPRRHG